MDKKAYRPYKITQFIISIHLLLSILLREGKCEYLKKGPGRKSSKSDYFCCSWSRYYIIFKLRIIVLLTTMLNISLSLDSIYWFQDNTSLTLRRRRPCFQVVEETAEEILIFISLLWFPLNYQILCHTESRYLPRSKCRRSHSEMRARRI